jgi:malate synthase
MEDAATAEISRSQIWQWLTHGASVEMESGETEKLTTRLFERLYDEEIKKLSEEMGPQGFTEGRFVEASQIFSETATAQILPDFLTIPAYKILEN